MSGGSYDYIGFALENACLNRMYDPEMNKFVIDFIKLLHDLEWWQSSDISEEAYRKTLKEFKTKWFKASNRDKNLKAIIEEETQRLKTELLQMIGD